MLFHIYIFKLSNHCVFNYKATRIDKSIHNCINNYATT